MSTKIIADFCSNHLGDRRLIEQGIKVLSETGVDIVKFQSFKADRLNKNWPDYEKAKEYYKSVELSDDDHVFILEKCKQYGIEPLFTAFDIERADYLLSIGVDNIKIASPNATDFDLISSCLGANKLIISTGMCSNKEVKQLCDYLDSLYYSEESEQSGEIVLIKLLYCISKYPTKYEEVDFDKMQLFDGFSDHTADLRASMKAIDLGMGIIERHFTLGKWLPGNDHKISSTPDEFKELVDYRNYKEKCELYKTRWTNA